VRLPPWPLLPEDTVAVLALALIAVGVWARVGWDVASMVLGALLLAGYVVRELQVKRAS
jgi:hypothetical protein